MNKPKTAGPKPATITGLAHLLVGAAMLASSSEAAAQAAPTPPPSDQAPPPAAPPPAAPPPPPAPEPEVIPAVGPEPVSPDPAAAEPEPVPEDVPEDSVAEGDVAEGDLAEVVVTGFRVSLSAALQRKQRATGQVDAIVADDIADFPDQNLAESLQRIPGVAINRTNGEGNQITVRGLPSLYTRVRINGMEARSSVANNGTRNFDFNLFASELFNSIVVHKTAAADLEEGSLGAVVDLNTARAFNYDEGFTVVTGAQVGYNDLSNTARPRLTGLIAYRDPAGIWGATASAAYTRVRLDTTYTDTVQWQKGAFRSVDGVVCAENPDDVGCAEVSDASIRASLATGRIRSGATASV